MKAKKLLPWLFLPVFGLSACSHSSGARVPNQHAVSMNKALMLVYLKPERIGYHKQQAAFLKPYDKIITDLPVKAATLTALHSVADSIGWISEMKEGHFDKNTKSGLDTHEYASLSEYGRYGGLVAVDLSLELTKGFKQVLLVATVEIQRDAVSGPVPVGHKVIVEEISLEHAGPPLSGKKLKRIHSSNSDTALQARAGIWFAHDGHRLKNAVLFDLSVFGQNLRKYLVSHD